MKLLTCRPSGSPTASAGLRVRFHMDAFVLASVSAWFGCTLPLFVWAFVRATGPDRATSALAVCLRLATGIFGLFGILGYAGFYGYLDRGSRDISSIALLSGAVGFCLVLYGHHRLATKT